jgi:bifunctional DNase/RNase
MSKREFLVDGLRHSVVRNQSYLVLLREVGGDNVLSINIGGFEAQAIALALDNMKPSRPMTHDLLKSLMDAFHIRLDHVHISRLHEGVFYANLVCELGEKLIEIDSRTSDALAVAVRAGCPIFVEDDIVKEAARPLEEEIELPPMEEEEEEEENHTPSPEAGSESSIEAQSTDLSTLSVAQLEQVLSKALEDEDYERAARVRDEINKRG